MLQNIGIRKNAEIRFELGRFKINKRPRHSLFHRDSQACNDPLARINRNVTGSARLADIPVGFGFVVESGPFSGGHWRSFGLNDERDAGEELDRAFHIVLKRRRQWNRQAIEVVRKHHSADFDGKIATTVNDRQAPDLVAELECVHGHLPPLVHSPLKTSAAGPVMKTSPPADHSS